MRTHNICLLVISIAIAAGCGTNPVTGKSELHFVSEAQEIKMGEQSYAPARQNEGGDMEVMPELTTYISEVGQKLAAHSKRKLPYEFHVLNNSVPNAWAMPGGKISVNRGLLTELKNEAELAAVLGHEIVHADARHGAKAQERGTLMQAGMAVAQIGAAVGGVDPNVAGVALSGAGVGLQMTQMKYGRDQELEADHYGTQYMKEAGYDPTGAVTLQETFVRMSKETGAKSGFFDRMFASHPPSVERVEKNKEMVATLGAGGDLGEQRYQEHIAALMKAKPAYDQFDAAQKAMSKKDYVAAKTAASSAVNLLPTEGRFHQMLGEIEVAQKHYKEAVPYYEQAMRYNPNYYGSYLGAGIAQYELGNKTQAQQWLKHSNDLLPTAPAAYYLGNVARERGDKTAALSHFKAAASSQSSYGQQAAHEFVSMDITEHPEAYLATGAELDRSGRVIVVIQNRSSVALTDIHVTPVLVDAFGHDVQAGSSLHVGQSIASGQQVAIATNIVGLSAEQAQTLRVRVDGARTVSAEP